MINDRKISISFKNVVRAWLNSNGSEGEKEEEKEEEKSSGKEHDDDDDGGGGGTVKKRLRVE